MLSNTKQYRARYRADEWRKRTQRGGVHSIGWLGNAVCQTECNTSIVHRGRAGDTAGMLFRQDRRDNKRCNQRSEYERYAIARLLRPGYSRRGVAPVLDRHPSAIVRKIERNLTRPDSACRPDKAQQYTVARPHQSRRNLQYSPQDRAPIVKRIQSKWSPAQIVGRAHAFRRPIMSAETIY